MDNENRFNYIAMHLKTLTLAHLRTLSELRALEAMVENMLVLPDKADAWHANLNKVAKQLLQKNLETLEKLDPQLAAMIDQRDISELDDLD